MKIGLILSTNKSYRHAVDRGHPYKSYAPLTLARLASLVPPALKAQVRLIDLICEKLPPDIYTYDLVGISSITCGIPFAYQLADNLRSHGVTVVIGGAHVTAMPEEAQVHADSIVVGYGEKSWPQLLTDKKAGKLKSCYTDFSNPFSNPLPYLKRHTHKGKGYFFNPCIEFSRGCPNNCGFCTVGALTNGQIHSRPIEEVVKEISQLGRNILFLDSNFIEILLSRPLLGERLAGLGIHWYAGGSLKLLQDEQIVKTIARYGCRGLLIGFESVNPGSNLISNKKFNDPGSYITTVKRLHDNGIRVLGCFVFGLEDDGPDVFEATVDFVQRARVDILRYAIATPFPGTRLYTLLSQEDRISTKDWELYDTEHVVFRPAKMSAHQLYVGHKWAFRETYRFSSITRRITERFSFLTLFGNIAFRNLAYTFDTSHRL